LRFGVINKPLTRLQPSTLLQNLVLTPSPPGCICDRMISVFDSAERHRQPSGSKRVDSNQSTPSICKAVYPQQPLTRIFSERRSNGSKAHSPIVEKTTPPHCSHENRHLDVCGASNGVNTGLPCDMRAAPTCGQSGQPSQNCHVIVVVRESRDFSGWARHWRTSIC
jgi:hypothetical protein